MLHLLLSQKIKSKQNKNVESSPAYVYSCHHHQLYVLFKMYVINFNL